MQTSARGVGVDKSLYRCTDCGLELSLINARGDNCPRCPGHFEPIHPLAREVARRPESCDWVGCNERAISFYVAEGETCFRCREHEYNSHLYTGEEAIGRMFEEAMEDVNRELFNEAEMDRYSG